MRRIAQPWLFAGATLALAACGSSDNDPGPGGVSVGEARMLDEAAEMIEARRLPPDALQSGETGQDASAAEQSARDEATREGEE